MKHSYFIAVTIASMIAAAPLHAGWADKLKEAVQDEELQKQVIGTAVGSSTTSTTSLDTQTLIDGLKEALEVGSKRAISEISQPGGYLDNQQIRIPLPDGIDDVASLLRKYGLEQQVDQFEESMNRAAEKAAPQATDLIVNAVKEMTFEDAKKIYEGADDSATEYFKSKTSDQLRALFQPSVKESLGEVGATRYYSELAGEAKDIPFVGDKVNVDLDSYVTEEALNGLFTMLAAEEKRIRENPAARTTDLLKKVFN
ncbi:DUF4197 domain-containing protein [uncultured Neptuniibacter sp.]|uniref:DUF4197 domain-containing protein n=1 Tax=uncultured Neptuniibacter sp. TaxID=502143 RepID=UPI002614BDFD|nr:DUF4197 domain-containing protein [uncultured Neptuniibacter sp.]